MSLSSSCTHNGRSSAITTFNSGLSRLSFEFFQLVQLDEAE
ncbi:hypothetical protein B4070_4536 [Bacillus subtilis]|nr:hypothetical protein B4070_4536 [Bacillus subtilis]